MLKKFDKLSEEVQHGALRAAQQQRHDMLINSCRTRQQGLQTIPSFFSFSLSKLG
jgi:hypothetical protein